MRLETFTSAGMLREYCEYRRLVRRIVLLPTNTGRYLGPLLFYNENCENSQLRLAMRLSLSNNSREMKQASGVISEIRIRPASHLPTSNHCFFG
jgi:hypothetical protein